MSASWWWFGKFSGTSGWLVQDRTQIWTLKSVRHYSKEVQKLSAFCGVGASYWFGVWRAYDETVTQWCFFFSTVFFATRKGNPPTMAALPIGPAATVTPGWPSAAWRAMKCGSKGWECHMPGYDDVSWNTVMHNVAWIPTFLWPVIFLLCFACFWSLSQSVTMDTMGYFMIFNQHFLKLLEHAQIGQISQR